MNVWMLSFFCRCHWCGSGNPLLLLDCSLSPVTTLWRSGLNSKDKEMGVDRCVDIVIFTNIDREILVNGLVWRHCKTLRSETRNERSQT